MQAWIHTGIPTPPHLGGTRGTSDWCEHSLDLVVCLSDKSFHFSPCGGWEGGEKYFMQSKAVYVLCRMAEEKPVRASSLLPEAGHVHVCNAFDEICCFAHGSHPEKHPFPTHSLQASVRRALCSLFFPSKASGAVLFLSQTSLLVGCVPGSSQATWK